MSLKRLFWGVGLPALLLVGLCLCWVFGSFAVKPERVTAVSFGPTAQPVGLVASDGVTLSASFLPGSVPGAPGILFLHGVKSSRNQFLSQAKWLNSRGYAILAIDFRGHGESQQVDRSFGYLESRDAHAAFDWLQEHQHGAPIGVIGTSLGGAAALLGADGPLPAEALVLEAVYPDMDRAIGNRIAAYAGRAAAALGTPFLSYQSILRFGCWPSDISPIAALPRYHGSLLVIGGGNDRYTPPEETRAMFAAARTRKQLWIIPGYGHGQVGTDGRAYRAVLGRFLDRALPVRSASAKRTH